MIEARDLKKAYGEVQALDGLGFEVAGGTIFGLLGPNGAGKSTTVKIVTTLARPDSGAATVAGHDVQREAAKVRRIRGRAGFGERHERRRPVAVRRMRRAAAGPTCR
jgi:ABC-2 type transport system ATP-binding protein